LPQSAVVVVVEEESRTPYEEEVMMDNIKNVSEKKNPV
jgi:hypothetical protein